MPEKGIIIKIQLGVQGKDLLFGRYHQRIDLNQGTVVIHKQSIEFSQHGHKLLD